MPDLDVTPITGTSYETYPRFALAGTYSRNGGNPGLVLSIIYMYPLNHKLRVSIIIDTQVIITDTQKTYITKTRPCKIQIIFSDVKIENSVEND